MKPEIFKVQRPLWGLPKGAAPEALVYNEDRSVLELIPYDERLGRFFEDDESKIYMVGEVEKPHSGKIKITLLEIVGEQEW